MHNFTGEGSCGHFILPFHISMAVLVEFTGFTAPNDTSNSPTHFEEEVKRLYHGRRHDPV